MAASLSVAIPTDDNDGELGPKEKLLEGNGDPQIPHGPIFSSRDRFGRLAITILIVTTTLILGALGGLWVLWTSDQLNKSWHAWAVRDWSSRAVTLS